MERLEGAVRDSDAEAIHRKSEHLRRNVYRPEHGGEERGDGGGALERDFAHAKEYKGKASEPSGIPLFRWQVEDYGESAM